MALLLFLLLGLKLVGGLKCACDPRSCGSGITHCSTDGGVCFASIRKDLESGEVTRILSCLQKEILIPRHRPFICEYNYNYNHSYVSKCCSSGDFCNAHLTIRLHEIQAPHASSSPYLWIALISVILFIVLTLSLSALILMILRHRKNRRKGNGLWPKHCWSDDSGIYHEVEVRSCRTVASDDTLQDFLTSSGYSGSGSGLPLLVQRSVARQISLAESIFSSIDEKSWFREVEIYQTVMLRHDNILGFIAADNKDNGTWTQLWLVTEYMENGSLFDFLNNIKVLETHLMVRMASSIVTGLNHLHMDIVGTQGKPAIAHRDLKSKIYTRQVQRSMCYWRFRFSRKTRSCHRLNRSSTHGKSWHKAFYRARGFTGSICTEYKPPYFDYVGQDPSLEEMKKVVCIDNARPTVPNIWSTDPVTETMGKIMHECWYPIPASRLTTLRIRKTISALESNNNASELTLKKLDYSFSEIS
ncbi:TGFBR1 [Lepeophtheirus salmonis]|uniref:receptor protein serine/threonine kinase n=1 Tax=Lepeophtheirus salmonis TaxID=72036 RepID=A0A7R8CX49_LEPSM|nr:TGFBR1 [Lepeophtheirus salmonis]CAF2958110.1 TGFBR1 [Lepeophtheirus salmonis]